MELLLIFRLKLTLSQAHYTGSSTIAGVPVLLGLTLTKRQELPDAGTLLVAGTEEVRLSQPNKIMLQKYVGAVVQWCRHGAREASAEVFMREALVD